MDEPSIAGLLAYAGTFAVGIQFIVAGVRQAVGAAINAATWVWMLLSAIVGVAMTLSLTVPVAAVPGAAPDWYKRVLVGLVAAGLSGAWHEAKNMVRAIKLKNEQQVSGGGPSPEAATKTPV